MLNSCNIAYDETIHVQQNNLELQNNLAYNAKQQWNINFSCSSQIVKLGLGLLAATFIVCWVESMLD